MKMSRQALSVEATHFAWRLMLMERIAPEYRAPSPQHLTPDQIEAIARQLPGRHLPDLARLQSPVNPNPQERTFDSRVRG